MAEDGASGFARVREIERSEGRFFVHPYNGYRTILGTATLGAEWAEQCTSGGMSGLDAVILARSAAAARPPGPAPRSSSPCPASGSMAWSPQAPT